MFHWRLDTPVDLSVARSSDILDGRRHLITAGFTNRSAGLGVPPFDGFNLGGHVGDDPRAVEENRSRLAGAIGLPRERLVFMNQVHGARVVSVDGPGTSVPECDGIVTTATDLALCVLVADCTPVLLHDAAAGVIGAVHAGRPGMLEGVVTAAVAAMRAAGAREVTAVVGPSVCGRCYEVPEAMAAAAAAVSAPAAARSWVGTPAIDVAAGVVDQLVACGVSVDWVAGCTREEASLYSYRRDGRTGRFAGVIVQRSAS